MEITCSCGVTVPVRKGAGDRRGPTLSPEFYTNCAFLRGRTLRPSESFLCPDLWAAFERIAPDR